MSHEDWTNGNDEPIFIPDSGKKQDGQTDADMPPELHKEENVFRVRKNIHDRYMERILNLLQKYHPTQATHPKNSYPLKKPNTNQALDSSFWINYLARQ